MKWLKHILILIALLTAALPCVHAGDHTLHAHEDETEEQLCASHSCACHSCDEAACTEDLDVDQQTVSVTIAAGKPVSVITLLIFNETKPAVRPLVFPVSGALASMRTIQLLI